MFPGMNREKSAVEVARDDAALELPRRGVDDPSYAQIVEYVKTLSEPIAKEQRDRVSGNTMLMVAGNVAVAVIVVGYESRNVITTKALSFLMKTF